jgi:hypothetical protein
MVLKAATSCFSPYWELDDLNDRRQDEGGILASVNVILLYYVGHGKPIE